VRGRGKEGGGRRGGERRKGAKGREGICQCQTASYASERKFIGESEARKTSHNVYEILGSWPSSVINDIAYCARKKSSIYVQLWLKVRL